MMKVLVAGSQGQLGQALQAFIPKEQCVPLSHASLDIFDLAQVEEVLQVHKPDFVVNAAAYNQVDQAEDKPEKAFQVNETGPRNLAEVTAKMQIRFCHVSTDYVFDGTKKTPYDENDPPHPISKYAESKLAGEKAVFRANPEAIVVRTAWVFYHKGNNFLKRMLELSSKQELKVNRDQVGSPTYAPHLAEAILELLQTEARGLYHLAGQGEVNRYDLTKKFFDCLGIKANLHPAKAEDFPNGGKRPLYSPLISVREPKILLPPWQEGVEAFAKEMKATLH